MAILPGFARKAGQVAEICAQVVRPCLGAGHGRRLRAGRRWLRPNHGVDREGPTASGTQRNSEQLVQFVAVGAAHRS